MPVKIVSKRNCETNTVILKSGANLNHFCEKQRKSHRRTWIERTFFWRLTFHDWRRRQWPAKCCCKCL